jgi:ubiquitin C-terminal hydrolase
MALSDSSENVDKVINNEQLSIDERRKKVTTYGLAGLTNFGNTCYLNSALQCLSATDLLVGYFLSSSNNEAEYIDDLKNACIVSLINAEKKNGTFNTNIVNTHQFKKALQQKFKSSLTYALRKILVIMWNEKCRIKPRSFKNLLGKKKDEFAKSNQCDAQECISDILEIIHDETKLEVDFNNTEDPYIQYKGSFDNHMKGPYIECMKKYEAYEEIMDSKNISKERKHIAHVAYTDYKAQNMEICTTIHYLSYKKKYLTKNYSTIFNIFSGFFFTQTTCEKCNNISFIFEVFNTLSIPIKKSLEPIALTTCLDDYFKKEEKLTDACKYMCEYCDSYNDAIRTTKLWTPPKRMIIQLKRFCTIDGRINIKINTKITYPIKGLDMSQYMSKYNGGNAIYDLYAIIVHGGSIQFGHYIAITKNFSNGLWYLYDDSNCVHIEEHNLEKVLHDNNAYILLYNLRE